MKTVLLLAVLVFGVGGSWTVTASPIRSVVVYGDSYSDNGNLGRESNGLVIVEDLAADLGVPLVDHAWVGATTGIGNLSDGGGLYTLGQNRYPGMTTSVYQDLANGLADPAGTLFVVWGGHNDILVNGQNQGVLNVVNLVKVLQAAGAEHILVPGVMDLGLTPFGNRPSTSSQWTTVSRTFNSNLESSLPPGVIYVDSASLLQNLVTNAAVYGFTNTTAACSLTSACANPDKYLFWDLFHPTARADNFFAADFAQAVRAVPEPSIALLTGLGLLISTVLIRRT